MNRMSYQAESARQALGSRAVSSTATPRVIYWIGLTSMLTDISSEMIASILPVFMFSVLNLAPLQVGFIDGIYQGAAAVVRVAAGYLADARQNNRVVAFAGYFLSALARIGFLLSGVAGMLVLMLSLLADRLGKGVRTAPRDALIAGHVLPALRAQAFGVHRTMDAVGAFAGPLLAAGILWLRPEGYVLLFGVSLGFAVLGLIAFWWNVPEPARAEVTAGMERELATMAASPTIQHDGSKPDKPRSLGFVESISALYRVTPFMQLLVLAVVLSLFTISDGLMYVSLQRKLGLEEQSVPLMFVATAFVFLLTAMPIGRLAGRIGCAPVLLIGYGMLTLAYLWFAFGFGVAGESSTGAASMLQLGVLVAILGVHYAATDGVMAALAVSYLPVEIRTTGLAALTTAIGLTRIGSSTLYGWTWQTYAQSTAAIVFALGMALCFCLILILRRFGYLPERRPA